LVNAIFFIYIQKNKKGESLPVQEILKGILNRGDFCFHTSPDLKIRRHPNQYGIIQDIGTEVKGEQTKVGIWWESEGEKRGKMVTGT